MVMIDFSSDSTLLFPLLKARKHEALQIVADTICRCRPVVFNPSFLNLVFTKVTFNLQANMLQVWLSQALGCILK